jgi:hypothetical protein
MTNIDLAAKVDSQNVADGVDLVTRMNTINYIHQYGPHDWTIYTGFKDCTLHVRSLEYVAALGCTNTVLVSP